MQSQERQTTAIFKDSKGRKIFYRNWKPTSFPKSALIIIHGLNSHSAYYQNFATELNKNNIEVYAIDQPGRGYSDGERYYTDSYNDILIDIDALIDIARTVNPGLPLFLLGHSSGGVFAGVYVLDHQHKLKGFISESFAFQVPAPAFAQATIKLLAYIIPHTRLIKLNNEDFSRNKAVVDAMNSDPLLENEKQPNKSTQQLLLASAYLRKRMADIKLPLLILHGTSDKVTMPAGSKYFIEHASSKDKQLKLYDGYYHDLLNDKDNALVMKDIILWINERI